MRRTVEPMKAATFKTAARRMDMSGEDARKGAPRLATAPQHPARPNRSRTGAARRYEAEFVKVKSVVFGRSQGRCEVYNDDGTRCGEMGSEYHHRRMRSAGGSNHPLNILHACGWHHVQIHANPATSYQLGLLVHSWQDPADIPVRRETAA